MRTPLSRSQSITSGVGADASGTVKTVPALARIAFGLNRSVRGDAAMTASAPAPSALRITAPTLPGFSTASITTTSGSGGSSRPARSSDGIRATATTPSERSPNARISSDPLVDVDQRDRVPSRCRPGRPEHPAPPAVASQTYASSIADAGIDRAAKLATPVDERQTGSIALASISERSNGLDPGIGGTRELGRGRERHRGHDAAPADRAKAPSSRRRPSRVASVSSPVSTRPGGRRSAAARRLPRRPASRPAVCAVTRAKPSGARMLRHAIQEVRAGRLRVATRGRQCRAHTSAGRG